VDKSMVQVDTTDAVTRYRQLELTRRYALERLEESGDAATYRARHAAATGHVVALDWAHRRRAA